MHKHNEKPKKDTEKRRMDECWSFRRRAVIRAEVEDPAHQRTVFDSMMMMIIAAHLSLGEIAGLYI